MLRYVPFLLICLIHTLIFTHCIFPPQVSSVCVLQSTLSVCVLSVEQDGKRHAVGRVLFPLAGELSQAGRVLWRDLETEDDTQVTPETNGTFACGHKCSSSFCKLFSLSVQSWVTCRFLSATVHLCSASLWSS